MNTVMSNETVEEKNEALKRSDFEGYDSVHMEYAIRNRETHEAVYSHRDIKTGELKFTEHLPRGPHKFQTVETFEDALKVWAEYEYWCAIHDEPVRDDDYEVIGVLNRNGFYDGVMVIARGATQRYAE